MKLKRLGKKAMVDDLLDFLFTVIVAFFMLVYLGFIFNSAIKNAQTETQEMIIDFNRLDSAINNLRVQSSYGTDFEGLDLESMIIQSKTLGGKTITTCNDYETELECQKDILHIVVTGECVWYNSTCFYSSPTITG